MKSSNEDNIHKSIKYNVWTSTETSNKRLNEAYMQCKKIDAKLYMFFSVNNSGCFLGAAEMTSEVDFNAKFALWSKDIWMGKMRVEWRIIKDIPNVEFKALRKEDDEKKSICSCRDCTELPSQYGFNVLQIMMEYPDKSSVLDMFEEFDKKEVVDTERKEQRDIYRFDIVKSKRKGKKSLMTKYDEDKEEKDND